MVLDGSLSLTGQTWKAGSHAWVPAFTRRHNLGSETGCLVFAWFGGTPRWIPGEPTQPASPNRHRTWFAHRCFHRVTASVSESLDLEDWTWRSAELLI